MKSIIYYTGNNLSEPIFSIVQKLLLDIGLPIVSCSLAPINFGENICLDGLSRSYPTMCLQIWTALNASKTKYVFFCEHDVLYHPSHFDFIPERDDIYYYNLNNWRWDYPKDRAINCGGLSSLSMLCCNRELALRHYELRLKLIKDQGLDKLNSREPRWARQFGYEPGTKKRRRGGVTDEEHIERKSEYPNVDIRHRRTFSPPKITLESYKHPPTNWREVTLDQIPGWNLKELFNL